MSYMKHSRPGWHVDLGSAMASERLSAEPGGAIAARHCGTFLFKLLLYVFIRDLLIEILAIDESYYQLL